MNNKTIIICLILISLSSTLIAKNITQGHYNGNWWNSLSDKGKTSFLTGIKEGFDACGNATVQYFKMQGIKVKMPEYK